MKYFSEHERSENWSESSIGESVPNFDFLLLYNEDIFEEKDIRAMNLESLEPKDGIVWGYCTEKGGFSIENLSVYFPIVANFLFQIPAQEFLGGFFSKELEGIKSRGRDLRILVERFFQRGNTAISIVTQDRNFRFVFLKELDESSFQKAYSAMEYVLSSDLSPGSYIFDSNCERWVKFN